MFYECSFCHMRFDFHFVMATIRLTVSVCKVNDLNFLLRLKSLGPVPLCTGSTEAE